MLEIKKCGCGSSSFSFLVDNKLLIACAKCGLLISDIGSLRTEKKEINFKLGYA
jgi:hypothetical protein